MRITHTNSIQFNSIQFLFRQTCTIEYNIIYIYTFTARLAKSYFIAYEVAVLLYLCSFGRPDGTEINMPTSIYINPLSLVSPFKGSIYIVDAFSNK